MNRDRSTCCAACVILMLFSAEPEHVRRSHTLRKRRWWLAGLSACQLAFIDWAPLHGWSRRLPIMVAALVLGAIAQRILHRGKQFEALALRDELTEQERATDGARTGTSRFTAKAHQTPELMRDRTSVLDRPPVVYLRPFTADAKDEIGLLHSLFEVTGEASSVSLEEQLSNAVISIGPLIAIGQPGEELPTPGAIRMYAVGDEWRDIVERWIVKARLVILRPGATPGIGWEIDTALRAAEPHNLLMLLFRVKRKTYEQTSAQLNLRGSVLPPFSQVARLGRASGFVALNAEQPWVFMPLRAPFWRGPGISYWENSFTTHCGPSSSATTLNGFSCRSGPA